MILKFAFSMTCAMLLALLSAVHANAQTGIVKGKVKELNGKPIEGVVIRATNAEKDQEKYETKSDGKGEFELTGLPPARYSLTFEKQGYKTFTTRKLEVAPGDTIKLSRAIELPRESDPYAVIRGAVFHGVGYTLPNATIVIERIDGGKKFKQETVSREGGEFAFRLKAEKAKYRVTATARGFQPASIEIEIEGYEARNVALTLQAAR